MLMLVETIGFAIQAIEDRPAVVWNSLKRSWKKPNYFEKSKSYNKLVAQIVLVGILLLYETLQEDVKYINTRTITVRLNAAELSIELLNVDAKRTFLMNGMGLWNAQET